MAHAVRPSDYLAIEETVRRQTYWEQVVQGWLWRLPCALLLEADPRATQRQEAPSTRALQNYGWLKEPLSSVSH